MKIRNMLIGAMAVALCMSAPLVAQADDEAEGVGTWKHDGKGWWFEYADGTYAKNEVLNITDDKGVTTTYMFDANGYMGAGGWVSNKEGWFYTAANGAVQKGWQAINGKWYYLDKIWGTMYANEWVCTNKAGDLASTDEGGVWYYLTADGSMATGWTNVDPNATAGRTNNADYANNWWWFYTNADGSAYDGWLSYNGRWYFIDEGVMLQSQWILKLADGTYTPGSIYRDDFVTAYYVGRDGAMVTGWYYTEYEDAMGQKSNQWMYTNGDGTYYNGWLWNGSNWYFIGENGVMAREGLTTIYAENEENQVWNPPYEGASRDEYVAACKQYDSHTWLFNASGALTYGWYAVVDTYGTTWCYSNANGNAYTGWVASNNIWYYVLNGEMVTNAVIDNIYNIGSNGAWVA